VGSCGGRTCWQYCVVRSGPTTPFELNLSLVPTLIFEWTADHWRFSCYCVSAVSSSNHHHQHEQLCIHSSRSLRGDSRDIAHALGRPPRRVLCTMSAFRVNVQIDLSTTTNTAAAVFSLVCCLCIQRRHCGVLFSHRRAPELRLQAITLFWSTSGGLWMVGTLSHLHKHSLLLMHTVLTTQPTHRSDALPPSPPDSCLSQPTSAAVPQGMFQRSLQKVFRWEAFESTHSHHSLTPLTPSTHQHLVPGRDHCNGARSSRNFSRR
jgi:hypothetical protein